MIRESAAADRRDGVGGQGCLLADECARHCNDQQTTSQRGSDLAAKLMSTLASGQWLGLSQTARVGPRS